MKSKRFLTTAAAMMMVFAVSANAMAFNDTASLPQGTQTSIDKLAALEVLHGYADGSFKADGKITRAEFTKIAMSAAGLADSAEILAATPSTFSDVKNNAWYTGWINLASAQGYIEGYPDGTFRPNETISQQEAVTILMRVLGYTDNLTGPWPVDYVTQASKLGILDEVKFLGAADAIRGDIAVIANATLDQKLVAWSKDTESFVEKTNTLLESSFKGQVISDAVIDGLGNAFGGVSVNNFDKGKLSIAYNNGSSMELADKYAVSGDYGLFELAGMKANIIYEQGSKKNTVKYIEITSQIKDAAKAESANGKVKLDGKTYNIASGVSIPADQEGGVRAYIDKDGVVYGLVALKDIVAPNPAIVKNVNEKAGRIEVMAGSAPANFKGKNVMVVKNGVITTVDKLAKGDVIYTYSGVGEADYLYIVDKAKEGKIERLINGSPKKLQIDGVKYVIASAGAYAENSENYSGALNSVNTSLLGNSGSYVLNRQNQVMFVNFGEAVTNTSNMIGVVLDYTLSNSQFNSTDVATLTVVNEKGNTVTYDVESGIYTSSLNVGDVIKFRITEDGKIDKNLSVSVNNISGGAADITNDGQYLSIGGVKHVIDEDAFAINLKMKDGRLVGEKVAISDIMKGETLTGTAISNPSVAALRYMADGLEIKALFISNFGATQSGLYGVIEETGITDANITDAVKFYGDENFYEIASGVQTAVAEGSLYKYEVNGDTITSLTLVYDGTDFIQGSGNTKVEGEVTIKNGELIQVTKSDSSTANLLIEEDTKIFDMTGDGAELVETVATGDNVAIIVNGDGKVELIVIK